MILCAQFSLKPWNITTWFHTKVSDTFRGRCYIFTPILGRLVRKFDRRLTACLNHVGEILFWGCQILDSQMLSRDISINWSQLSGSRISVSVFSAIWYNVVEVEYSFLILVWTSSREYGFWYCVLGVTDQLLRPPCIREYYDWYKVS